MQRECQKKISTFGFLTLLTLALISAINISPALAPEETVVKVIPQTIEKGPENVTGEIVSIAVVVESVTNLYGFDIKFKWNTTYLEYVNRTVTVPVEDYPDPQPPSPYPGILHENVLQVKDDVNTTAGTYHIAYASMAPALTFNGSGTVFTMRFRIKYQQWDYEGDQDISFGFIATKLSDKGGVSISHTQEPGSFIIHGIPFVQPEKPTLKIVPENYEHYGEIPTTFYLNLSILNLDAYWDMVGFDVKISFETKFLQIINVSEGPFLELFNITFQIKREINNTEGYVRLSYMQLMPPEERPIPEGNGTLFTFEINATAPISETEFAIVDSKLASFPHPERNELPWQGKPWSVPIPHYVVDGLLHIIHRKVHQIIVDAQEFEIISESNSTISEINYEYLLSHRMIQFDASGFSGFVGYCNITIPKGLMWIQEGSSWVVLIDGQIIIPEVVEDGTNAYLYFTYDFHSVRKITIISTDVVFEFPSAIFIAIFLALTLAAVLAFRKRAGKRNL
jgi:hypothetical protein